MDRARRIVVTLRGLTALRLSNIFRHVNPRSREDREHCDTHIRTATFASTSATAVYRSLRVVCQPVLRFLATRPVEIHRSSIFRNSLRFDFYRYPFEFSININQTFQYELEKEIESNLYNYFLIIS